MVPVAVAYEKEAYNAAALRPHIQRLLPAYLQPLAETMPLKAARGLKIEGDKGPWETNLIMSRLRVDPTVAPVAVYRGGTTAALARLTDFLNHRINSYATKRRDPGLGIASGLSPYLHFGQIGALQVALQVQQGGIDEAAQAAFLEELIVRRELAMNFVYYRKDYDTYESLPPWARQTLEKHRSDPRPYRYGLRELEEADTHDPYWNAAQRELVNTGYMHPYMRMYWGKMILAWSPSPEEAFHTALYLNNRYALDGRDPNSFAGVAWCFGKHDRPWPERPIFGTVRFMNAAGLERKFAMKAYLQRVG
ncbi:MAG: hypothetical protein N2Z74_01885 [Syntrophales bacterium]|nr:hypothetical protein [Syntrophales bacterium]